MNALYLHIFKNFSVLLPANFNTHYQTAVVLKQQSTIKDSLKIKFYLFYFPTEILSYRSLTNT